MGTSKKDGKENNERKVERVTFNMKIYTWEKRHHYKLWDWISKNPSKVKGEWIGWKRNGGALHGVKNDCFACEVAMRLSHEKLNCSFCPLEWGEVNQCCEVPSLWRIYYGLQRDCNNSNVSEHISRMAIKIRNLPWKGYEEMMEIAKRLNFA